ncbi:hypothetical protein TI39_contig4542g00001 [Zymoseptoria brevis]|uniref:Uncharacterized protein n=1 Tax=Zymoseptoria brevis TaxID=1047168 RepID=A0A0F4G7D6_9PEZI|nr:hypothetical protein TI39_contig4542g00001 [Zymoseptoria brevis]
MNHLTSSMSFDQAAQSITCTLSPWAQHLMYCLRACGGYAGVQYAGRFSMNCHGLSDHGLCKACLVLTTQDNATSASRMSRPWKPLLMLYRVALARVSSAFKIHAQALVAQPESKRSQWRRCNEAARFQAKR